MHTEYEVRILEIDEKEMIKKLESLNAQFEWEKLQKRYVYDFHPKEKNRWIRLRTNGLKTTLTIKNITTSKIDGTQELEVEVDNFERCNLMLKEMGYTPKSFQENKRRQYKLNGVEIDIDYWPNIPTYMEIEGSNEESVYYILDLLGINKEKITTKDVQKIYLDYGYKLDDIKELKLEEERK